MPKLLKNSQPSVWSYAKDFHGILCWFLGSVQIKFMSTKSGLRSGSGRKVLTPRSRLASKEKKKKRNRRWEEAHQKLYIAKDVYQSWKKIKCMCVYSTDTAFAQHLLSLEMRRRMGLVFTLIIGFPFAL